MRGCEADRCDAGATVNGRWCERHGPTEYALEAPSERDPVVEEILAGKRGTLAERWLYACEAVEEAEQLLTDARGMRVLILDNMRRTGMSLGDIAKVTGLTRQRIGQLLKDMPKHRRR